MFKPDKKLGQNFLQNRTKILQMIAALDVQEGEKIIEIGPGLGALTMELVNHYHDSNKIIAVELDVRFVDKLLDNYKGMENIEIVEGDILQFLPNFDAEKQNFKLIGSLPYYITSPIIYSILKMHWQPKICVLLVQNEVAKKIMAKAPESTFISTFVQTFYDIEYLGKVDKSDFSPVPMVDGGILKLTRKPGKPPVKDVFMYEKFLKHIYSAPRKMLNKVLKLDELNRAEVDGSKRPQDYNSEKWVDVFTILR